MKNRISFRKALILGIAAVLAITSLWILLSARNRFICFQERTDGDFLLFCSEHGRTANDLIVLPSGWRSQDGYSVTFSATAGKRKHLALWIWNGSREKLTVSQVKAEALWSMATGSVDMAECLTITAPETRAIRPGLSQRISVDLTPDAELPAGTYRLLLSVTAQGASGEMRQTMAVSVCVNNGSAVEVCRNGKCDWTVVEKTAPSAAERYAVDLFVDVFRKATGCTLSIRTDSEAVRGKEIIIGNGGRIGSDEDQPGYGANQESAVISVDDDVICLYGTGERGTLYAVCAFLENYLGYRVPQSGVETVSTMNVLALPRGMNTFSPNADLRAAYSDDCAEWNFALPAMLNGANLQSENRYGGTTVYAGPCEQYLEDLLPASTYFRSANGYFSDHTTSDADDRAQLCLSSPSTISALTEKIRQLLKDHPLATRVSLRHRDCGRECTCKNCAALCQTEGSMAGAYLACVDRIAETLAEEFPGVIYEMVLEGDACMPCRSVPQSNVAVLLSDAGKTRGKPYVEDHTFWTAFQQWSGVCSQVGLVTQCFNPREPLQPVTDLYAMGTNLQVALANGARNLILTGCGGGMGGESAGIKGYLFSCIARYADYPAALAVHDYLCATYGKARTDVLAYYDLLRADLEQTAPVSDAPSSQKTYSKDFVEQAEHLLDRAERTVAGDGETLFRIRKLRMSIRYVRAKLGYASAAEKAAFLADAAHYGIDAAFCK